MERIQELEPTHTIPSHRPGSLARHRSVGNGNPTFAMTLNWRPRARWFCLGQHRGGSVYLRARTRPRGSGGFDHIHSKCR